MNTQLLSNMFVLGLPVAEKIIRPIIVYFFLIAILRLTGRRQLAQLNPFDFVVLLTLSNTVQNAIIGNDNSVTGGIIGATTLLLLNYLVIRFLYRHKRLDQIVEGSTETLIEGGKIDFKRLRAELITRNELESAAHKQGFDSLDEIEQGLIDPDGAFSFVGKEPAPEVERYQDLVVRIDQVKSELARLNAALENLSPGKTSAA